MNQESFVAGAESRWRAFEAMLRELEAQGEHTMAPTDRSRFPEAYRGVCRDLALARQRRFDAFVVDRLNRLALRGHQVLYRAPRGSWRRMMVFWIAGFPQAVRREASIAILATVLFYGSAAAIYGMVRAEPDLIYTVMAREKVVELEAMYNPASEHHLRPRSGDTDVAMFGFYIRNNMSVGFRTFAGGIFAGVGSLLLLILNGVFLGAVVGHLQQVGFLEPLLTFVAAHGAPELTAITLTAAAGLRLGWALIAPGTHRRFDAVRLAGRRAIPLVYGATGMLLVAAVIEAFWSANTLVSPTVKYSVGAVMWVLTLGYLILAGRPRGH